MEALISPRWNLHCWEAIQGSEQAQALVIHYTEVLWAKAQQLTACNAIHDASPRLARLLLQCADRIGQ
jgi:hypothetical protein